MPERKQWKENTLQVNQILNVRGNSLGITVEDQNQRNKARNTKNHTRIAKDKKQRNLVEFTFWVSKKGEQCHEMSQSKQRNEVELL